MHTRLLHVVLAVVTAGVIAVATSILIAVVLAAVAAVIAVVPLLIAVVVCADEGSSGRQQLIYRLQTIFNRIDVNKDGQLDVTELRTVLNHCCTTAAPRYHSSQLLPLPLLPTAATTPSNHFTSRPC